MNSEQFRHFLAALEESIVGKKVLYVVKNEAERLHIAQGIAMIIGMLGIPVNPDFDIAIHPLSKSTSAYDICAYSPSLSEKEKNHE